MISSSSSSSSPSSFLEMKSPDMAAITDSLQQSFRNFSLNQRLTSASGAAASSPGVRRSSSSSSSSSDDEHHLHHRFDTTLELNSHISLPPFWEQCLDLKTGEVYYMNCRTGMKVKEDPRTAEAHGQDFYWEDEGSSSDGSEESSSSSSCGGGSRNQYQAGSEEEVLVVAGCKRCFMYFMVPKQVEDCPKCSSRLVHFDRSDDNGFP